METTVGWPFAAPFAGAFNPLPCNPACHCNGQLPSFRFQKRSHWWLPVAENGVNNGPFWPIWDMIVLKRQDFHCCAAILHQGLTYNQTLTSNKY